MTRPVFAAYESAGRWDRPLSRVKPSVDRLQWVKVAGIPVSVGIHTEMDNDQLEAAFTKQPGNWRHVRLDNTDAAQIVATYDRDHWKVAKARALVLSKVPIRTSKGVLLPFPTMLEVVLDYVGDGPTLPGSGVLHLGDTNLDMRGPERARVLELCAQAPGFHQSWALADLPKTGTHGRALIDNGLTDLPIREGGARLLADDQSSDHRPFGCVYGRPSRLYLQGLHWPLQNTLRRRQASQEVRDRLANHWERLHWHGHGDRPGRAAAPPSEALESWDLTAEQ